ncbi:hypothetical protein COO60DRAFT_1703315 [Scenedesmus sp. NREL 46B-D3]|nr:hypothetical protein COO60DRAFT_1703315 [Scenedesmus sp. NREL 46B-D3]
MARHRSSVVALVLLALLSGTSYARQVELSPEAQLRHRRSLLGATQQISQCEWLAGEGCALHPSYVTYALNRTLNDVVARYVTNSLTCASVVEKGACEGVSYCTWDPSFSNGQQGCFLAEAAMLNMQQQCIRPASRDSLSKLQTCMEARHSCQCSGGSTASACQTRQQQLLAGFRGRSKVCQSLLGCWLSNLNGSTPDILQLVEVQLGLVQPSMEVVRPGSNTSSSGSPVAAAAINTAEALASSTNSSTPAGRRRALQQNLVLSNPVLDEPSSDSDSSTVVATVPEGYNFESGSYTSAPSAPASSSGPAPSVGMNGVILGDGAAAPPAGSPVEYGKNIPGVSNSGGSGSSGGMNPGYNLEAGTATDGSGSGWEFEQAPLDPDKVFGNSSSGTGSGESSSGGSSSAGSSQEVQMTGGNAPASFWRCAGAAAVKADTTRKWADVDYNSKGLTLATWLRVIQPTSLIDWGVQVMECFKAEVTILSVNDAAGTSTPNKESTEYAIVALIRTFSAQADTFRSYLQAGPDARATAGLTGLTVLSRQVFPDQTEILMAKYNSSPAYNRDVMLQAAAVIADMQWFTSDALALASAPGSSAAAQQQVFEAVVAYGEDMVRRCLYWLFHVQFEGAPGHLPGVPATTVASVALVDAFGGLAAAALPAPALAADAPAWQQMQGMLAVAAGWAGSAASQAQAQAGGAGVRLTDAQLLGNSMDALAKAHVADLWGTRVELARASAPEAARQLALGDPSQQAARWQPVRDQQVQLLSTLQQLQAAGGDAALHALRQRLQELVAASGGFLLTSSGSSAADVQRQSLRLSESLQQSSWLAHLVRQCYGSPAGLAPLSAAAAAAAGVPASGPAACSLLAGETQRLAALAAAAGEGISGNLASSIGRQWACSARDPDTCNAAPGCQLALAGTLVPGSAAAGGGSGSPSSAAAASAELLLEGTAASDLQLSCQASDSSLLLSSMSNSSKSGLAISSACDKFLQLPACESLQGAAACASYGACRWERSSERNLVHTVGSSSASASAAGGATGLPAAGAGVCSVDWVQVLSSGSGAAYSSLGSMISLCGGISDDAACTAQTMLITLDTTSAAGGGGSIARIWVPALVVAAVLGGALFGGVMLWRRRSAGARRAAEEARAAGGGGGPRGGSAKKGKDGKGGKASKAAVKKKVRRAEPGQYKPDLMRDSFTDYMRSAPQQFENGVALAKAAMAAGSLDAAVAAGDVAGARQAGPGSMQLALTATAASAGASGGWYNYPQQPQSQQQQQQQQAGGATAASGTGRPARWSAPQLPPLPPAGSVGVQHGGAAAGASNTSDLIDLQTDVVRVPSALQQQLTHQAAYGVPGVGYAAGSGAVWGAAAGAGSAAASHRMSGGALSAGLSGGLLSGGLSGDVDLIDTGASLALTSSLGLVSSLPQHSSMPVGVADAQQFVLQGQQQRAAAAGAGAGDVLLGLLGTASSAAAAAGRRSGGGRGFGGASAGAAIEAAHSGSLLLGGRGSGDIEDGASTPTSSCCHDSVCTFRHGPGSSVGSGSVARGPAAAPPLSTTSSTSWRGAAAGGRQGGFGGGRAASASGTAGQAGLGTALSGALSGALSRSSWSSAMSTDMLMSTQHSAAFDP